MLRVIIPNPQCAMCHGLDPQAGQAFMRSTNACSEPGCLCACALKVCEIVFHLNLKYDHMY